MEKMKVVRRLFAAVLMVIGMFAVSSVASAEDAITVTVPTDRAVYQRDNSNKADVTVTIKFETTAKIEARALDGDKELCNWSLLTQDSSDLTMYTGKLNGIPAGGWYTLEVQAKDYSTSDVIATATVEKFGVGEVFITGGQSNSCNFGGAKQTAEEDTVSAFDPKTGKWQHCEDVQPKNSGFSSGNGEGSPWPAMGDALVSEIGVPVGFLSTGRGGASIEELNTVYYNTIKEGIEIMKPYGVRAFLLHQGEADSGNGKTKYDAYYDQLTKLIEKSREDAGYNITWMIAKASYTWYSTEAQEKEITDAQEAACNNYDIFRGADTDSLLKADGYRHTDDLHLSEKGLIEHGRRWAAAVFEKLLTQYELKAADGIVNGKIEQGGKSFYAGDSVNITVVPDDGYCLKAGSVKVNDGNVDVTDNTFTMRAEEMTVSAEFEKLPQYILDLGTAIKSAEAINLAGYTDAGKSEFAAALSAAKKIYDDSSKVAVASETDVRQASEKLAAAMKALVLKPVVTPVPTAPANATAVPATAVPATSSPLPIKGLIVSKGGLKYTVTTSSDMKKTVTLIGIVNKNKTKLTVPKTIKINGYSYKVTAIGKKAFQGAKKLKNLSIKSTDIKFVGKNAFMNVNAKIKIKVPAAKLATFKKLFKGKGLKGTAKIVKL